MPITHRVESKRNRRTGTALPVDRWQGRTFVEATGTVCEVVWDGTSKQPLCADWPAARESSQVFERGRLHLKPRAGAR